MASNIPYHKPKLIPAFVSKKKKANDKLVKNHRWRRVRAIQLEEQPLCEACYAQGKITAANQVHHIIDRAERPDLAYEPSNLQSLCASCHSSITNERKNAQK